MSTSSSTQESNISTHLAKRFRFLFTLPQSTKKVYAMNLLLTLFVNTVYSLVLDSTLQNLLLRLALQIPLQIAVVEASVALVRRGSKIANRRRLSASFLFVNGCWAILSVVSFAARSDVVKTSQFLLLSAMVATTLALFLIWPVFTTRAVQGMLVSIANTLPILVLVAPQTTLTPYSSAWAISFGLLFFTSLFSTMIAIDRLSLKDFNGSTFRFLKAFLYAWINQDSTALENSLSTHATEQPVETKLIEIEADNKKLAIVIPNVHPGPFYPVGSYDLPSRVQNKFRDAGYDHCFVLHGVVNHTFNLASKADVNLYLSSIARKPQSRPLRTVSQPASASMGDVTINGIAMGDVPLLTITSWPKGGEDYPPGFLDLAEQTCVSNTRDSFVLVDAHNAIGEDPDTKTQESTLQAMVKCLQQLQTSPADSPAVSFTSIKTNTHTKTNSDMGEGGLGVLLMKIKNEYHALVYADANNSTSAVRRAIMKALAEQDVKLFEFCTSDSHFNAARVMNERGYLLLGEATPPNELANTVSETVVQLKKQIQPARMAFTSWKTKVKTVQQDTLGKFRTLIDSCLVYLKYGAMAAFVTLVVGMLILFFVG